MNTFTYTIKKLLTQNVNSMENYVVNAILNISGTDGTYTSTLAQSCNFEIKETDPNFIDYNSLTEEIVIGWCKEIIGTAKIEAIENAISQQIEREKNPPIQPSDTPFPW